MWFKDLLVPRSNELKTVKAVQLWEVRWMSRHGEYYMDVRPEMEAFSSEQEAVDFKVSLEQAFKLVRMTSKTRISITKESTWPIRAQEAG